MGLCAMSCSCKCKGQALSVRLDNEEFQMEKYKESYFGYIFLPLRKLVISDLSPVSTAVFDKLHRCQSHRQTNVQHTMGSKEARQGAGLVSSKDFTQIH